jgi:predicted CoA-binding protein
LLQRILHLSSEPGRIEFPITVKSSTGYDVIPVNPSNESDKKFLEILNSILKKIPKDFQRQPVHDIKVAVSTK